MRFVMALALWFVAPVSALAASPSAEAVPVDAGLAVAVSGQVELRPKGQKPAIPVTPYMKLRVGDRVDVGPDGKLDVVYFGGGRRESWGPGSSWRVAAGGGEALSGEAAAVTTAGDSVGASLEALPIVLRHAEAERSGQTLVRGGAVAPAELALDEAEQAQLQLARDTYAAWRKTADPGDVLPEMYLASVLIPYQLHDEAVAVLERAVAACPTCGEARLLLDVERGRAKK